jgi:UDP-2,3-diacylglucosamine pyrophosphatase LpxH
MTTLEQKKAFVQPYIAQNTSISNTALARQIKDENPGLKASIRTIRWWISLARADAQPINVPATGLLNTLKETEVIEDSGVDETVEESFEEFLNLHQNTEDENAAPALPELAPIFIGSKFEIVVVDNIKFYKFINVKEEVFIEALLVDKIFIAYNINGLNYTKAQIVNTLHTTFEVFNMLVNKLNLTKHSDLVGPYAKATIAASKQSDYIEDLTAEILDGFVANDSATANMVIREYKKKLADLHRIKSSVVNELAALKEKLPQLKVKTVKHKNAKSNRSGKNPLYLVLADLHIGLETEKFNSDIAWEKMSTIINEVNNEVLANKHDEVHIFILGDLPHTVSGLNHLDSWKTIEKGSWGANALIRPFEILAGLVSNIFNLKGVYGVGGNHGRLVASKEAEPSDEGEKLIFYMLDLITPPEVDVEFDADRIMYESEHIKFILLHGDLPQDKQSGRELSWLFGDVNKYNLILLGHFHSRMIHKNDDGPNYRKMYCPSFVPTDQYAERLGVESVPGFLLIGETFDHLPYIKDIPINY